MQAEAAVLGILISILIVWAPGHCGLPGNEFADQKAKLDAAESIQHLTSHSYMESSLPPIPLTPPIQHGLLKEVYISFPDEQTKMSFFKVKCTDLAHFHIDHHPAF